MKKIILIIVINLCLVSIIYAQLSGTYYIPSGSPSYSTIQAAVSDLNTFGISGSVTFLVAAGYTESIITPILLIATGTFGNTIAFQKDGVGANPKVTRTDAGSISTSTFGGQGDAVIIIQGSDYVTFDGIDVSTDNQGIEYGYYLRKASGTDGCKNVTIKNATIDLTKGTSNYVIGIYSSNNDASSSPSSATGISVTSTGGRNENVVITGNTIQDVFAGIALRGFNHTSSPYNFYDQNFVVGSAGAGNTIQNFAGNVTNTSYGCYIIYHNNVSFSYNTVNNTANGGSAASTLLYGVFHSTGTNSSFAASYNNINLTQGAGGTAALYGINVSATATGNMTFNNNSVSLNSSITGSGVFGYLYNSGGASSTSISISNNTFNGSTIATTGATYLIYNNNFQLAPGTVTIQNNVTSGTINRTGASGNFYCYFNNANTITTNTETIANNNFSNIALAGTSVFYGISSTTTSAQTQSVYDNVISNITCGSGTMYGINLSAADNRSVYGNQLYGWTSNGTIYGLSLGSGSNPGNIYKNKIYNLSSSAAGGLVYGIYITGGTNTKIFNNFISDLKAPNAIGTNAIVGLYIGGGTTVGAYFNSIYLNASSNSATTFGTSGIYKSATTIGDLINNIVINTSIPGPTGGLTVAYGWSNLYDNTYYTDTSDFNNFYAGNPSPSNLIFYDGTNSVQTLSAYKTLVNPRDANSNSVSVNFVSSTDLHLTGASLGDQNLLGTYLSSITTDIDGDVRQTSPQGPYMGADEANVPLPIEMNAFTAISNSREVILFWETKGEINSSKFEVERSSANTDSWVKVGEVSASGNSNSPKQYNFTDKKLNSGKYSYRLKMVDSDGSFKYSDVVEAEVALPKEYALSQNYPNPFNPTTRIDYQLPFDSKVTLELYGITGEKVATLINSELSAGYYTTDINASAMNLASGVYIYRMTAQNQTEKNFVQVKKLMLTK